MVGIETVWEVVDACPEGKFRKCYGCDHKSPFLEYIYPKNAFFFVSRFSYHMQFKT